jgi:hypothetical protein
MGHEMSHPHKFVGKMDSANVEKQITKMNKRRPLDQAIHKHSMALADEQEANTGTSTGTANHQTDRPRAKRAQRKARGESRRHQWSSEGRWQRQQRATVATTTKLMAFRASRQPSHQTAF